MAPVAKRNQSMSLVNNDRGQISIFFSASLIVLISVIAFVINVGLFVKAKINLQNATDAAAFAGAAVQSRQLTKIAYLNWEMRNVYKEWMYKYYVIGNVNVPGVDKIDVTSSCADGPCTTFRMTPGKEVVTNKITKDHYNFPSTCIHINGSTNVCTRFSVPGLPEFGGLNISGAEEASRTFMDGLIGAKIDSCNERSMLNALVATSWIYNVLPISDETNTLASQAPAIALDRQGAWPKALELAMRIRNLEKVVNRQAITESVCMNGGDCTAVNTYENENLLGNERIVKAFYSGYRNLGNHIDSEMKNTFKLKELAPTEYDNPNASNPSNLLLPADKLYPKQYLDLKLMMVNYAVFYNAFLAKATGGISGECPVSKMAIPVPGYPMGFYKNPSVLTYYAVKGEAEFVGMFNPINEPIKLHAYAAAKPMGGRIGPMLFKEDNNATKSRDDANKYRSVPYFLTFDPVGTPNDLLPGGVVQEGSYGPNVPLPINLSNEKFWITSPADVIGGKSANAPINFGIPNLVYDYLEGQEQSPFKYTDDSSSLHMIRPVQEENGDKAIGLFNHDMFLKFRGDLNVGPGLTASVINSQIRRVRAPTRYEAANYLFPMPNDLHDSLKLDSFGLPTEGMEADPNIAGLTHYSAYIYSPLYKGDGADHEDILYETFVHAHTAVVKFMWEQETAMRAYIKALNTAAVYTYKTSFSGSTAATGAQEGYRNAAKIISDIEIPPVTSADDLNNVDTSLLPQTCHSMAGQFWHFYFGATELIPTYASDGNCPKSLPALLKDFFSNPDFAPSHYKLEYSYYKPNFPDTNRAFGAYVPGPFNGISSSGNYVAPSNFASPNESMRRNFYSTKLISLDSIQKGSSSGYNPGSGSSFNIHSEGEFTATGNEDTYPQGGVSNLLDPQSADEDLENIRH